MALRRIKLKSLVQILCFVAVLVIVGTHVRANFAQLVWPSRVSIPSLLGSVFLGSLGLFLFAVQSRMLLAGFGIKKTTGEAVGLQFVPLVGKYMPGKVWAIVFAMAVYRRVKIPVGVAGSCITLSMVLGLVSAGHVILVFGCSIFQVSVIHFLLAFVIPFILYAVLGYIRSLRKWLSAKLFSADAEYSIRSSLIGAFFVNLLAWTLFGGGFALLAQSISDVSLGSIAPLIAVFIFAQIAGIVAVFAPAGIGVQEGVLLYTLSPIFGDATSILVAGMARLWQTLLEFSFMAFGWYSLKRSEEKHIKQT